MLQTILNKAMRIMLLGGLLTSLFQNYLSAQIILFLTKIALISTVLLIGMEIKIMANIVINSLKSGTLVILQKMYQVGFYQPLVAAPRVS